MNSKERVLMAIDHKYPDRIPKHSGFTPEISKEMKSIFNIEDKDYALDLFFGHDILWYEIGMGNAWDLPNMQDIKFNEKGIYYDKYGIGWSKFYYGNGNYLEMVHHPLADNLNLVENLKLPDIKKNQYEDLKKIIKKYGKEKAIIGGISSTAFEAAWYLRGQTQFLIDLIKNPDIADILIQKVVSYHLDIAVNMVKMGVDLIFLGDDVGAQDRPIISRKMVHQFLTPKYAEIVEKLKKINPNIKFAFHCCGHIDHILPELIDAGIDIIQVMQPDSVDFESVKKQYGKKISFWGGIDVQHLIPNATTDRVISAVKNAIDVLGKNGGYIIGMTHNVQPGPRSIENTILAYYAIEKYGNFKRGNIF